MLAATVPARTGGVFTDDKCFVMSEGKGGDLVPGAFRLPNFDD